MQVKNLKKPVDKTKNVVNLLDLYRTEYGIWCFDDKDLGIIAEPFVGDINLMIDMIANGKLRLPVFISHSPIYEHTISLTQHTELGEGVYQLDGTEVTGWLCPVTLMFFKEYPKRIYVKIASVK